MRKVRSLYSARLFCPPSPTPNDQRIFFSNTISTPDHHHPSQVGDFRFHYILDPPDQLSRGWRGGVETSFLLLMGKKLKYLKIIRSRKVGYHRGAELRGHFTFNRKKMKQFKRHFVQFF